jgi:replicative DNA helicase
MKTVPFPTTSPAQLLPPDNNAAEFSLLGSVLLDAAYGVPILQKEGVSPHWFYDLRHQNLYRAILELFDAGGAVNEITLHEQLRSERWYQEAGDLSWLTGFALSAISPYNVTYYLPDVKDAHCRRIAFTTASRLLAASAADGATAADALECAENIFTALREQSGHSALPPIVDAVDLLACFTRAASSSSAAAPNRTRPGCCSTSPWRLLAANPGSPARPPEAASST